MTDDNVVPIRPHLSDEEKRMLEDYRLLSESTKHSFRELMRAIADKVRAANGEPREH